MYLIMYLIMYLNLFLMIVARDYNFAACACAVYNQSYINRTKLFSYTNCIFAGRKLMIVVIDYR